MAKQATALPRMTSADFLDWNQEGKFELVDGAVRAMSPGSATHARIQARLAYLIERHLTDSGRTCWVATEPAVAPRLGMRHNVRVPDLAVTCAKNEAGQIILPDPILLVEVLSPGNQSETWDNVRSYASIPSVSEIAVVHSTRTLVELLRLGEDGNWPENPETIEAGGIVRLSSIGAEWPLTEIYRGTHLA